MTRTPTAAPRTPPRPPAFALTPRLGLALARLLAGLLAGTLAASASAGAATLDTRAASQRTCLALAQAAGHTIIHIARPVPVPGRPGHILAETVRMQRSDGRWLRCTYDISLMEAELRWN